MQTVLSFLCSFAPVLGNTWIFQWWKHIGKYVGLLLKQNPSRYFSNSYSFLLFPSLELKPVGNDFQQFLCAHLLPLPVFVLTLSLWYTLLALIREKSLKTLKNKLWKLKGASDSDNNRLLNWWSGGWSTFPVTAERIGLFTWRAPAPGFALPAGSLRESWRGTFDKGV